MGGIRIGRAHWRRLAIMALFWGVIVPTSVARPTEGVSGPPLVFDIPAQALASALEAYSIIANREVIYDGRLADGRRSTAIAGLFTPEAALRRLLEGARLDVRYMAHDAFVLVPMTEKPPAFDENTASPSAISRYYGRIQANVTRLVCVDQRLPAHSYRLAVSLWVAASGKVSRVELLGTTGAADHDAHIERGLRSLSLWVPLPHGFAQPVTLVITPPPKAECVRLGAVHSRGAGL